MGHLDAAGDFDRFSLCETHVRPNLLHPSQRRYHDIVAALGDRGLILRGLEVTPNQESRALHRSRMVVYPEVILRPPAQRKIVTR